ncbi:hydroxymethylglutaryl-CoA lyase [Cladophialophora psammophila CBS 110553]|uniref:hydroxymethylglutaryl-CoA lyase n=1 Tax=Cladophialophora psammophila CBS 110553 TaxID=1182543 RepID=W9XKX8_9EURO|nr:hydroxymethylglutaryl-CoA lyase [Cladophialophora psammophila CBS 110553]EXJ71024.1 hydroxymethylglutaryl-CoA lyase [Cladophialophora psammophila CBS 110553]
MARGISHVGGRRRDVRIVEVGPRDGLQNIKTTIPTATKLELIARLRDTGLETIEITSVVSPRAIPQLADCRQVLANQTIKTLLPDDNLRLPVLIPNLKGLQIAMENSVREVAVFVSASEGFSRANINATVDEGLARARQVAQKATAAGLAVRGYISCIFADPFDGPTPQAAVLKAVRELLDMGCYEVSLGDTLGIGTAADVRSLLLYLENNGISAFQLAGHFHDTYGQAVGNVWQAYQCGLRVFDSSVGGLGGCPFAPGAKGNAATEDLVFLFQQAGLETGVDLPKLVEVGNWISDQLKKPNESRAGVALTAKHALLHSKSTIQQKSEVDPGLSWTLVSETESIRVYRFGVNLKVVLNQPKKGNALTTAMIGDLTELFRSARGNRTISRIVITAEGKYFCAGMDLGKGTSPVAQSSEVSDAQYGRLTQLFEAIDKAPQVTIAGINGSAFGGGVGLAFACDIRIAAKSATFTLSEAKLGLCPATISTYVIRECGFAFTREAMLSARAIPMDEFRSLGLITKVVDEPGQLPSELDRYLIRLKVAGPEASTMCKELIQLGWAQAGSEQQAKGIKQLFDKMMRPDGEAAIGLRAFQATKKALDWDEITLARSAAAAKPKL